MNNGGGDIVVPDAPAEFSPKKLTIARHDARRDMYFFARWMLLREQRIKWIRATHHDLIAQALERVYRLETLRLIINLPPRYSKTAFVQAFIAWSLGRHPDSEYIYVSYNAHLAEGKSREIRDMVTSAEYREIFPDVRVRTDSSAVNHWMTTAGGVIHAAGSQGTITGFGAGKRRAGFGGCFPAGTKVWTDSGLLPIDRIVRERLHVRAWAFDYAGNMALRSVVGWHENPPNDIVRVTFDDGAIAECTPDHRFWTENRGWVRADSLRENDHLPCVHGGIERSNDVAINSESHSGWPDAAAILPAGSVRSVLQRDIGLSFSQDGAEVSRATTLLDDTAPSGNGLPGITTPDLLYDRDADPEALRQVLCRFSNGIVDGQRLFVGQDRNGVHLSLAESSVRFAVNDVLSASVIAKVSESVVLGIPVGVANVEALGPWSYKCQHHEPVDHDAANRTFDRQAYAAVAAPVITQLENSLRDDIWRAGARDNSALAFDSSKVADGIRPFVSGYRKPALVEHVRHDDVTFCLTVEQYHNFTIESGLVVKNCIIIDDPLKPEDALLAEREEVNAWFPRTIENRLNSPHTPIILIAQRLHERDLPGWLLEGGNGQQWEHLCLPALSDAGEPLWPAMHSLDDLKRLRDTNLYEFSAQYLQRPVPLGGAYFNERSLLLVAPGQDDIDPAARIVRPVEAVSGVTMVFAIVDTAVKTGANADGLAIVYFAYSRYFDANMDASDPHREGRSSLTVLDWDYTQIEGAMLEVWLPTAIARVEELAGSCRALQGSAGVWIEDKAAGSVLLQQAANKGWHAHSIDSKLTSLGKSERAINISGYVHGDQVKFARQAYERVVTYKGRTRNHLLSQILSFNPTVKDQGEDDLLDCFSYGVSLGLGNAAGF